ncbi:MAG: isochorismatase family protein [Candidatus Acidiferrum sp.]
MANAALIVVDVQRDFCEGGALPASDTLSLLRPLQQCIEAARRADAAIVYTKDWHPEDHSSFRATGGPWPIHCVADTKGAELMPPLQARPEEIVIHKGVHTAGAGYSGFELTGLEHRLKELGVARVGVTGIATEYCVRATALDALQHGLEVTILSDLIRAVQPNKTEKVLDELRNAGAKVANSAAWLKTL